MTCDHPLRRLAERAGIATGYHDIRGQWRDTADEVRRHLLAAMGFDVSSDTSLQSELECLDHREWMCLLPPVAVAIASDCGLSVRVNVPAEWIERPFRWAVDGGNSRLEGEFVPADAAPIGRASIGGRKYLRCEPVLDARPSPGDYTFTIRDPDGGQQETALIVCPSSCHVPAAFDRQRRWGPAIQLYGLRSARNWGCGDFTDLAHFAQTVARLGADTVALNPLHALYPNRPGHYAPYSPSQRQFLNVLYIDPEAVPELADSAEARERIDSDEIRSARDAARQAPLIDYSAVAASKRPVLEALYRTFCRLPSDSPRAQHFAAFREERGLALYRLGLFDALDEHIAACTGRPQPWREWPAALQDPESVEVADFARAHEARVGYFIYLQWLADEQLRDAADQAERAGMAVGLERDLAVGIDHDGAESWMWQDLYAADASIGAPPDDFHPRGQDWGLPPLIPHRLADRAHAPLRAILRDNMRHAGALRIDHVMGLHRLFWIPRGAPPEAGAYVHYPMRELFGVLALESRRQQCMIVGEDLGTVPDAVRTTLPAAEIHGCRVLYFEKDQAGDFRAPEAISERAQVSVGTHDLPPLNGYWQARDLELQAEHGEPGLDELLATMREQRGHDRRALLEALARADLLPPGTEADPRRLDSTLRRAIHRYLARSPARLMLLQPEDVAGETEPLNLPGTRDEYPNWRWRHPFEVDTVADDYEWLATIRAIAAEGRGR